MFLNLKISHLEECQFSFSCSCCKLILIHLIIWFTGTNECNIIQLAAVCGESIFNGYTVPWQPISEGAARITGFTVQGGALFHRGQPVPTMPLRDLLICFIEYLRAFNRPKLVAHNARFFDAPVLMRVLAENGLQDWFSQVVSCFVDTLNLSKLLYPNLIGGHSLKALVESFLGRRFDAHNALEDARILQELFYGWKDREFYIQNCTFSTNLF